LKRHARAYDAAFGAEHVGIAADIHMRELDDARDAFEKLRPYGWRDAEAAYAKDHSLAAEAGAGRANRAIRALQLETELRTNIDQRADEFVRRWQGLEAASQHHYERGDMTAYRASRSAMGDMAKALQRDPQLESLLAVRKAELGITVATGRSLGAELAFNHGIDIGRGLGIGL